jgi:hypothetical protein
MVFIPKSAFHGGFWDAPKGVRTPEGVLPGHQAHSPVTDLEKSVQRSAPNLIE